MKTFFEFRMCAIYDEAKMLFIVSPQIWQTKCKSSQGFLIKYLVLNSNPVKEDQTTDFEALGQQKNGRFVCGMVMHAVSEWCAVEYVNECVLGCVEIYYAVP